MFFVFVSPKKGIVKDGKTEVQEVMKILTDKRRREEALAGIGATKYDDAPEDSKELWKRLTADWYPDVFTAMKNGLTKALLSSEKGVMELLDISDEALCLLILDVKILELVHVATNRERATILHYKALEKKEECDRNNQPLPEETKKVLDKYGYSAKEKIKRGRKKRKKKADADAASSSPDKLEDYDEDTIPEHLLSTDGKSMELNNHKDTFAKYMQRVDDMRNREASLGWYAGAWTNMKKKWNLECEELEAEESSDRSHLSTLTVDSACLRPVAAQLISSWKKEYQVTEV